MTWTEVEVTPGYTMIDGKDDAGEALGLLGDPLRSWFADAFPAGPTPAQRLAWPAIASGENVLLISPTGTGKTLAGFLAIVDRLLREHQADTLSRRLRCVYISPLRSLGYDVEKNLAIPLDGVGRLLGLEKCPIRVGVRTGDTSAYERRRLRDSPPHILITTPESLSLLLSQSGWRDHWAGVSHVVVDEVHALAATKRGADLAISLERLAEATGADPARVGLSATCRPPDPVARFLVGPSRTCRVVEAPRPAGSQALEIAVESLLRPGEGPHRGLTYRRLLRRIRKAVSANRTTVVFANSRPMTEKIAHDLRNAPPGRGETGRAFDGETEVAVHHSALDAARRREVEERLKAGRLRAVVTSTSLELGVDVGTADLTVQVGLPGGVARCVQRIGRSGHHVGGRSRGLILAATAAEVAAGAVTARAARAGAIEPLKPIASPLDVVCQQLIGMACAGETSVDAAYELLRKAGPTADLGRDDFLACLEFLAGELSSPSGASEPEPGATPRWTAPRIWKRNGWFGVRSRRVQRWFWSNVGTINAEESATVIAEATPIGTVEGAYAERLSAGDRFVLDGRTLEFRRLEGLVVHARLVGGEPGALPVWHSDRQSLSTELAADLATFRAEASRRSTCDGPSALREWLAEALELDARAAEVVAELIEAQDRWSETPGVDTLLVEESPTLLEPGWTYAFHAPLNRSAAEALGRAVAARLGRRFGRDAAFQAADLGWTIRLPDDVRIGEADLAEIATLDDLADDVLEGVDRGELAARRFRHVAATALMVLRNPEPGKRVRVGGMNWVYSRLYPLVKAACPNHPLLRETRREILHEVLDVPAAARWLETRPTLRLRRLAAASPFATAWIAPGGDESLRYDSPADALRRLHARMTAAAGGGS
ncbi:DEAD/DEAH box helicase [Planctomyces sp. SH-PL62]|uniref:DEAD/DEAH box helicase n=1 Tax=Planctomyces sp. SH-PL62 TaxID=1636152 RepID=UPI00078C3371|nr:DEAD/DEAH box helicase [Planctomyces sp. SH-PL62]AMV37225.1 DEAD-box ATP-dependent RNA helicase CshB [Planctomyces sp. SH-PL62]